MANFGRPRRHVVAALVAAFLAYLAAGHAHHPGKTMDEAALGSGICIVLVVAAAVAVLRPRQWPSLPVAGVVAAVAAPVGVPTLERRARASPVSLQRFLN